MLNLDNVHSSDGSYTIFAEYYDINLNCGIANHCLNFRKDRLAFLTLVIGCLNTTLTIKRSSVGE